MQGLLGRAFSWVVPGRFLGSLGGGGGGGGG